MSVEPNTGVGNGEASLTEFDELRSLLLGPEQHRLDELSKEIHSRELSAEEIADRLPEAIALSGSKDHQLGRALSPTIDTALKESIRRDPSEVATAIFPVLGPAIRKAIAEALGELVRSINTAVEQSLSINGLKWRIEAWRTGIPYPEIVIKHALVYRVEQVFLVHTETGLLLEHVSARDLKVTDADLISSMLSAIQDFVRDSFQPGEGATLRTFTVGDHTVQVEPGPRALLAVVIRGQAPDTVLRKQQDTLEAIHLEFATPLADFTGDASPFVPARPLLENCLETVLSTTRNAEKKKLIWMKWAVPLILVIIALAALWTRSSIRWNRGLAALRAEPGIVVVDASRGFRSWNISGLKDPIARSPATVIAGAGVGSPQLSGRWREYMSLDPAIVSARARGAADSVGRIIESTRILFDAGSAALNPVAVATLGGIATFVHDLDRQTAAGGRTVTLELTGRTDPSGADATNATLSQQRIDNVARWLQSSGFDASRIARKAVATDDPLPARDSAERARVNRSVSFTVRSSSPLTPGGRQ